MKNLRKITAVGVLLAIAIIVSCKEKQFSVANENAPVNTSANVEHGKALVYSSCADCHYNTSTGKFTGNQVLDVPGIIGKVYAANLTHSKQYGMPPRYTDIEIKYLLKTGLSKDGHFIPYMLRPNMAESDLDDIIAYLRSDDAAVTAGNTSAGITHLNVIGKAGMNIMAKPLAYRHDIQRPSETESVALGYYLVDNLACYHCHSKSLTKLDLLDPDKTKGFLAGGLKLKDHEGNVVTAANITPDKNSGIGNYTKEQFIKAVKDGDAPDRKLHPPMPRFKLLTNSEVSAIYAYIQTVTPVYHNVRR